MDLPVFSISDDANAVMSGCHVTGGHWACYICHFNVQWGRYTRQAKDQNMRGFYFKEAMWRVSIGTPASPSSSAACSFASAEVLSLWIVAYKGLGPKRSHLLQKKCVRIKAPCSHQVDGVGAPRHQSLKRGCQLGLRKDVRVRFRLGTYQLVHRILHPSGGVGVEHSLWLRHLCEDLEIKLSTDYELGFLEKEQRTRERSFVSTSDAMSSFVIFTHVTADFVRLSAFVCDPEFAFETLNFCVGMLRRNAC